MANDSRVEGLLNAAINGLGTSNLDPPLSRNERLLYVLNERIASSGGSGGLPEGGTPYQQLVTDGDGNAKWEDRLAYETKYNIIWNGDTSGLPSATDSFYLVSSETNIFDGISKFNVTFSNGETEEISGTGVNSDQDGFILISDYVVVCLDSTKQLMGLITFPANGVYFIKNSELWVTKIEFTENLKRIDSKYLPQPLVVDATNLPTSNTEWGALYNEIEEAYKSGRDVALDLYGSGDYSFRCVSWTGSNATFIRADTLNLHIYVLLASPNDGGSFNKYTIAMTEKT